jgi:hypothetical protein
MCLGYIPSSRKLQEAACRARHALSGLSCLFVPLDPLVDLCAVRVVVPQRSVNRARELVSFQRLPAGSYAGRTHATVRLGFEGMDFFVYSRDAPGAGALRDDEGLLEEHWSYMDGFAESMIARGPTLGADRDTATGSLHVLGLPSVDAAHEFVAREPNNRAGVYAEHSIWRFENLLGHTMWEFSGAADEPRFLIIARSHQGQKGQTSGTPVPKESLSAELRERLILYGALITLDDAEPVGVALAVHAPDREAVDALLEEEQLGLDVLAEIEIHEWEFGGRR